MRKQSEPLTNRIAVVLLTVLATTLPFSTPLGGQPVTQEPGVRRAAADTRRLADQLLPGDKIVDFFLNLEDERVLPNPPLTPAEALAITVADSPQIMLVELESVETRLIDRERWVATRLYCKVVDVMKSPKSSGPRAGSHVSFMVGGGEIQINGVTVRAGGKSPYEVGRTYVAFLKDQPNPAQGLTSAIAGIPPMVVDGERARVVQGRSRELDGIMLSDLHRLSAKYR